MLFSEIVGHAAVKERLVQSVKDNRVSHALLFSGPPGAGGLLMAIAYSQYINCENRQENDSCGGCPSCIKMNRLIHPDVHFSYPVAGPNKAKSTDFALQWREALLENAYMEVQEWYEYLQIENKQGFISVEESADLLRKLSLKSYESEYKTAIMWLPEKMRTDAANKMLKIIEEPPDKTLFILVTENPDQIIPTILSRTQLVKTGRINDLELTEALIAQYQVEPQEARRITHLSDGNFNTAWKLSRQEQQDQQNEKDFIDWMRICFSPMNSYQGLLDKMERFARLSREEQKSFLCYSMETIRECLLMNLEVPSLLRFGENGYAQLKKFSAFVHAGNVERFQEELNKAYFHTERNANAKILFLDLSFKIYRILTIKTSEPVVVPR